MADRTIIRQRLSFWESVHEKLQNAYIALIEGGVKSYMIDDRQLTRFDIPDLKNEIEECEAKIDELEKTAVEVERRVRREERFAPWLAAGLSLLAAGLLLAGGGRRSLV